MPGVRAARVTLLRYSKPVPEMGVKGREQFMESRDHDALITTLSRLLAAGRLDSRFVLPALRELAEANPASSRVQTSRRALAPGFSFDDIALGPPVPEWDRGRVYRRIASQRTEASVAEARMAGRGGGGEIGAGFGAAGGRVMISSSFLLSLLFSLSLTLCLSLTLTLTRDDASG